jgi:AraC-like DNA-binding protein
MNWARYLTPSPAHRRLGLVCLGTGAQSATSRTDDERVLDCYAAVLVTRGSGQVRLGGETAKSERVAAPSLFWLRPGVPHSYGPEPSGWSEAWILFDGPAAPAYESLGFLSTGASSGKLYDPLPLRLVLQRLERACRDGGGDVDVRAAALVHEFLVVAKGSLEAARSQPDDDVLAALRADALTDMPVRARAEGLGLSVRQLREIVQRAAGCTPTEFVQRVRINRSKTLLAESDVPVTEVAGRVGFADPAYFSRQFRERVGVAPREFRAQQHRFLR